MIESMFDINFPVNLIEYIENNKHTLIPPVSNKLLYGNGQLKVMIVGGPNQRRDFHIEEGEELFYQLYGHMDLLIIEKNKLKTIHIPEGNFFILPSRIPHSPQRYENTVGIVFERARLSHEMDGLRWYIPSMYDNVNEEASTIIQYNNSNSSNILYEEYFRCIDLGTQLAPIIKR